MTRAPLSLLDAPTGLRRLELSDAPYGGRLHAGDPPTVWVDAEAVPDEVWRLAPDGHLLAPLDLARTPEGHAVVLPHCPRRLAEAIGAVTGPGEIVTIAVSMIRAAEEARREGLENGSWWVDGRGRPVLAAGGSRGWAEEADELVVVLARAANPMLRRALEEVSRLVTASRVSDEEAARCEDLLFALAEPMSLMESSQTVDAFPALVAGDPTPRRADSLRLERPRAGRGPTAAQTWLGPFVDAEWVTRVGEVARRVATTPARWREHRRGRLTPDVPKPRRRARPASDRRGSAPPAGARSRAPWLVAALVGAVVVAGGLWWPESGPPAEGVVPSGASASASIQATGESALSRETATMSSASPTVHESGTKDEEAEGGETRERQGAEAGARAALRRLAACAGADACADVFEREATTVPDGIVSDATVDTTVTLLDEYGGAAVFRVAGPGRAPQILVLVSVDGKWLVRDVYTAAHQP